jgi:hypothetical protein
MMRRTQMKAVESMTWDELQSALTEYQVNGNGGGMGVKDIQVKHSIEDEVAWRLEKGYTDLTPREIEIELLEQGKIERRYL